MQGEEIIYINSLHKFEKRCVHHYMLYSWVYAFKTLMPDHGVEKIISYFYTIHGNEDFNTTSGTTEYSRILKEVKELQRTKYFNVVTGIDMLHSYQKKSILVVLIYSWTLAHRLILPEHSIKKAIISFFKKHGCSLEEANDGCSKIGIARISKDIVTVEKTNADQIKNLQQIY